MTGPPLPASARFVVIGGGVIGCSTAYHLAQRTGGDVLLLERKRLTAGTTWHSAAQVRQLRGTRNLTELIKYSAGLYARLGAETGQDTGWRRTGSLSIATNPDRLIHIRRQAALARAFGIETHEIDAAEAGRLWPLMRTDDVIGAVWSPTDGRVNPSDLCLALAKGMRAAGGLIAEDTPVTGFEIERGRIAAVLTPRGRIACQAVAICCGLWSRDVASLAGIAAPLHACEHYYLLTRPIAGIEGHLPTLGDHDSHLYIRDDVGGLLVGCFEPNAKPLPMERLPADFAFDLLDPDWDQFEPLMAGAIHRIPALERAEVRMLLNGPESFTPDGAFLVGEAPEVAGAFLGCAMNSMGVASGGGVGRALADWMVEGAAPMDLWPVDIRRFHPVWNRRAVLATRAAEMLSDHYAIAYPGREPATARRLRLSPLHDALAARGAVFGERAGWERPLWFAEAPGAPAPELRWGEPAWHRRVAAEHHAARGAVALFDLSSFAKIRVQGQDAGPFMQRIYANDLAVPPGRIVYTPMLNHKAGYESDVTVMRLGLEEWLIVTGTAQGVRDLHWLRRHRAGARIAISDATEELAVIGVAGPNARALLSRLGIAGLDAAGFRPYSWQWIDTPAGPVRAARLSYTGEAGWELYAPAEAGLALYRALLEAGEGLGVLDAGALALTGLRIERGYRAWGHDLTPDDNPWQAGLGFAVRPDKPVPFIGQAALAALRRQPPGRRLVFLAAQDPAVHLLGGEPILQAGRPVGQVTSAAWGHTVGRSVAIGYVPAGPDGQVAGGGHALDVAGQAVPVTLSTRPFYRGPAAGQQRGQAIFGSASSSMSS